MVKVIEFQDKNKLYITNSVKEFNTMHNNGLSVVAEFQTYPDGMINDYDIDNVKWPHLDIIVTDSSYLSNNELYKIYQRINNIPWQILKTERTIVRESTVADVDRFYEIYTNDEITRYTDSLFENPNDEKEYMKQYIKNVYGFYGYGIWSVLDSNTNIVIGRAGISMIEGASYPELGFITDIHYQHKGLTYEVTLAILEYAKSELGLNTIQARVKPENKRSIALLKRLGFNIPHTPCQGYLTALHTFS